MAIEPDFGISLIQATGIAHIDAILSRVAQQVKLGLGNRILGCYLVGSYAVGEAVVTSDLDILVVCKGNFSSPERQKISEVQIKCQQFSETHLLSTGSVSLQS